MKELNKENASVILRNMTAYWLWHAFVSANALRLANGTLNLVGATPVATSEMMSPFAIGVNYMTMIGLSYRMYLAIARNNGSREGVMHSVFTYLYNQEYVGVLSNRRTLELMMFVGLLHNYYFHGQGASTENPVREFLFNMLLPAAVGHALDAVNSVIPFRLLVVSRFKALMFAYNACVWGGLGATSGVSEERMKQIEENIHNPLPLSKAQ